MEIEALYDCDSNSVMGFLTKGHVDKKEFAIACNKEHDLSSIEKFVAVDYVQHTWKRKVPDPEFSWTLHNAKPNSQGAFAATYVETSDYYFRHDVKGAKS